LRRTLASAGRARRVICPTSGDSVEFCPMSLRANPSRAEKSRARKLQFREPIQSDLGSPVPPLKIFFFLKIRNCVFLLPSRLDKRGVRVVTNAGRDAVDALAALDERRLKRTAKSCGPGAPTLALRSWSDPRTTGAKEPGPRGEHEISRKTIAQGRPDDSAPPVVTTVCFLPMHTGRGCALSTRSSLRPLISRGWFAQQLGRIRAAGTRSHALSSPSPRSSRGEGGVRGSLHELCSRREPLTRNSLSRISTSPREERGELTQNASRLAV
jgi:hypothetical protein